MQTENTHKQPIIDQQKQEQNFSGSHWLKIVKLVLLSLYYIMQKNQSQFYKDLFYYYNCSLGQLYSAEHMNKEAEQYYLKAAQYIQTSFIYNQLGLIKQKQRNYWEAQQYFERAIKLDEANIDSYENLISLFKLRKKWDYDMVHDMMKRMPAKYKDGKVTYLIGQALFQVQGQKEQAKKQALQYFLKSIEEGNKEAKVRSAIGLIYKSLGETQLAIQYFNKAYNIDRNNNESCYYLLELQEGRTQKERLNYLKIAVPYISDKAGKDIHEKRYGQAQKLLGDYLKMCPKEAMLREKMGVLYYKKGEHAKSKIQLELTLKYDSNRIEAEFYLGLLAKNQEQFEKAEQLLTKVIQKEEDHRYAFYELGQLYYRQQRLQQAESMLLKSIDINQSILKAYELLADIYLVKKDYEKSNFHYLKIKDLLKDTDGLSRRDSIFSSHLNNMKEIYMNIGKTFGKMQKYADAFVYFSKALEEDKFYNTAYFQRGMLYKQQRHYSKAIENFSSIDENSGFYGEAMFNLGLIYVEKKQFDKAEDFLLKSQKNYSQSEVVCQLGALYRQKYLKQDKNYEHLQKSKNYILWAIQKNVNNAKAYSQLSMIYCIDNKKEQAEKYAKKALAKNQNSSQILFNLGLLYMALEDSQKAQSYFLMAISKDQEQYESQYQLGLIYRQRGNINQSSKRFHSFLFKYVQSFKSQSAYAEFIGHEQQFKRVIKQNPDNYKAYFLLGEVEREAGNTQKAIQHFQKANQLNKKYIKCYCRLATIRRQNAIQILKVALSYDHENVQANFQLGALYYREGREQQAQLYLKKGIGHAENRDQAYFYLTDIYIKKQFFYDAEEKFLEYFQQAQSQSSPKMLYSYGKLLFNASRFEAALPYFSRCFQISNDQEMKKDINYYLGSVYQQLHDDHSAMYFYEEYIKNPGCPQPMLMISALRKYAKIRYRMSPDMPYLIMDYYQKAMKISQSPRERFRIVLQTVQIYIDYYQYQKALEKYEEAVKDSQLSEYRGQLNIRITALNRFIEIDDCLGLCQQQKMGQIDNLGLSQKQKMREKIESFRQAVETLQKNISQSETSDFQYIIRGYYDQLAMAYKQINDLQNAKMYWERSLKQNQNQQVAFDLAELYYKEGSYDKAAEVLKPFKQSRLVSQLYGLVLYKKNNFSESKKYLERIVGYYRFTNETKGLLQLANIYKFEQNYQKATQLYEQYLKKNSGEQTSQALQNLVYSLVQQGQYERAFIAFRKANLQPDTISPSFNLSIAEYHVSKLDSRKAAEHLEAAKALKDNDQRFHYLQGKISILKNKSLTAQTQLKNAISLKKGYLKGLKTLQQLYLSLKKYKEAEKITHEISDLYFTKAQVQYTNEDFEQAKKLLTETIKIMARHQKAHFMIGNIYLKEGKIKEALICFKQVIKINPFNVEALYIHNQIQDKKQFHLLFTNYHFYYELGKIFQSKGNGDSDLKAEECYTLFIKSKQINREEFANCYYRIGVIKIRLEKLQEAEKYLQESIQVLPNNSMAKIYLGKVYHRLSQIQNLNESLQVYEQNTSIFSFCGAKAQKSRTSYAQKLMLLQKSLEEIPKDQLETNIPMKVQLEVLKYHILKQKNKKSSILQTQYLNLLRLPLSREETCKIKSYLALIKYEEGSKFEAINYFEEAISQSCTQILPYYLLGKIYFQDKQFGKSEQYIRKALQIEDKHLKSLVIFAKILALKGQIQQALSLLSKIEMHNSDHLVQYTKELIQSHKNPMRLVIESIKHYKNKQHLNAFMKLEKVYNMMEKPLLGLQKKFQLLEQNIDWIQKILQFFKIVKKKMEDRHFKGKVSTVYKEGFIQLLRPFLNKPPRQNKQRKVEVMKEEKQKKGSTRRQKKFLGNQPTNPSANKLSAFFNQYFQQFKVVFIDLIFSLRDDQIKFQEDKKFAIDFSLQKLILKPSQELNLNNQMLSLKNVIYLLLTQWYPISISALNNLIVASFNDLYSKSSLSSGIEEMVFMLSKEKTFYQKKAQENKDPHPWYLSFRGMLSRTGNEKYQATQSRQSTTNIWQSIPIKLPQNIELQNLVKKDCVQLLIILVSGLLSKNSYQIQKNEKIFLNISKIWVKNKFRIQIGMKEESCLIM